MTSSPVVCKGCKVAFPSRNAIFKHLIESQGACLDSSERESFHNFVLSQQRRKVLLLIGYVVEEYVDSYSLNHHVSSNHHDQDHQGIPLFKGEDASQLLLQVLAEQLGMNPIDYNDLKLQRAYGHNSHGTDIVAQDSGTGAITELIAVRLPPIATSSVQDWINSVNEALIAKLNTPFSAMRVLGRIDLPSSAHKLSVEMDYAHRRIEYMIPMDFFWKTRESASIRAESMTEFFSHIFSFDDWNHMNAGIINGEATTKQLHYSRVDKTLLGNERPSHQTLIFMHSLKKHMQALTTQIEKLNMSNASALQEKEFATQKRLNERTARTMKRTKMKTDSNREDEGIGVRTECGFALSSAEVKILVDDAETAKDGSALSKPVIETRNSINFSGKGTHVLRRKRFHNFTLKLMAHEFLAFRRLDRFYHRATLRFLPDENGQLRVVGTHQCDMKIRPFMVLSLSGDLFLDGQALRMIGLFLAVAMNVIDSDIVDCVFDENYPYLVPTPSAPAFPMHAGEAFYTKWEGKLKTILTPRLCDHFANGWNDSETLQRLHDWTIFVRERTAQAWVQGGVIDSSGSRLSILQKWIDEVLQPWAARAREQLKNYRQWKASQLSLTNEISLNTSTRTANDCEATFYFIPNGSILKDAEHQTQIQLVDPDVPDLYKNVLHYLREADSSGLWPSTTPKRQLVMISTVKEGHEDQGDPATATSLAQALERAHSSKSNDSLARSSSYSFHEGQGGASGSFSIGAMPEAANCQPRANKVFPKLMKAAFELEIALRPDREPSSTIAINRNAQFRPHTDSGAGAGQSTSLIVGIGTYKGGELVVEGDMQDIRYNAMEFNGWKQRHWTMPFVGERYSLVWFTPKGCEGIHGIDLCGDIVY